MHQVHDILSVLLMVTINSSQKGFTIVELLIVIVVIAILAAITIVSYNNIQERTKTAAYNAAIDSWEKNIKLLYVDGVRLPDSTAYNCLGRAVTDFPNSSGFASGSCGLDATFSDTLMNNFTNKSQLPNGLLPSTKLTLTDTDGATTTVTGRGVAMFVSNASNGVATITFFWITPSSNGCSKGKDFVPQSVLSGSTVSKGSYCQYAFSVL
jgi:prepilin-type N-terminal cleavage/methylation domain-containing protein